MHQPKARICWILAASIAWTGCALLIPPSWRGRAPLPLAGPVDTSEAPESPAGLDPTSLSDEQLLRLVESDEKRLVEIATQTEPPSEQELREIANRLPLLLRELENRGTRLPGSHVRHPVIR